MSGKEKNFFEKIFAYEHSHSLLHSIWKGGMAVNEMEQRVWNRVMGQKEVQNRELKELAMEAQQAAAEYRYLLRSKQESHRELGRQLLKAEQENLACLKGLHYLQTGIAMRLPMASPGVWDIKRMVRRYHVSRRTLAEYMARTAESEWGTVFLAMAKRQEGQCDRIARLLGHMNQ